MVNIKDLFKNYTLNTYNRVGPVFVKGKGSFLWDDKGNKYLDFFPGWGSSILGHCHPRLVKAITNQANTLIHLPNNLYFPEQAILAQEIIKNSFPGKVFFCNSGTEATEGAVKFSRLYGKDSGRYEIITMKNSFHGRSFAGLSATGQAKYKDMFKPILPTFREVPFNDFQALQKKINKRTIAVILEFIQGEGGVNIADKEFISNIKKACQANDLLFIADEVQTGMGRTGELFCFKHYDIIPDIMTLAKGLGSGVPIGAFVVSNRIADIIKPGMHGSTFAGSPLVTRVGYEVFKVIKDDNLLAKANDLGKYIFAQFKIFKARFPFIKDVRGKGLMLALEFNLDASKIEEAALKQKLIIKATQGNIIRILPALNISKQELDKGLGILEGIFKQI